MLAKSSDEKRREVKHTQPGSQPGSTSSHLSYSLPELRSHRWREPFPASYGGSEDEKYLLKAIISIINKVNI